MTNDDKLEAYPTTTTATEALPEARFVKADRGQFTLNPAAKAT